MTNSELLSKLLSSTAHTSVASEKEIETHLSSLDWISSQSCFYTDPVTNKVREIDVVGRKEWEAKLKSDSLNIDLEAQLTLLLELKSAKGYHLLFPRAREQGLTFFDTLWIGYHEHSSWVLKTFENAFKDNDIVKFALDYFKDEAYPNGRSAVISQFRTTFPISETLPANFQSTAFRETNIDKEKDLDNSVFWRAAQALESASAGIKQDLLSDMAQDLEQYAASCRRTNNQEWFYEPLFGLFHNVRRIFFFHPIIVVDAHLWEVSDDGIKPTSWCRFQRRGVFTGTNWWCDVVHSSYTRTYLENLTEYYNMTFTMAGVKKMNLRSY